MSRLKTDIGAYHRHAWRGNTLSHNATGDHVVSPSRFYWRDLYGRLYVIPPEAQRDVIPILAEGMSSGRRTYTRALVSGRLTRPGGLSETAFAVPIRHLTRRGDKTQTQAAQTK